MYAPKYKNMYAPKYKKCLFFTFSKKIFEISKKKKGPHSGAQKLRTKAHTTPPYIFWPFLALQKVRNLVGQVCKKKKGVCGGYPANFFVRQDGCGQMRKFSARYVYPFLYLGAYIFVRQDGGLFLRPDAQIF
jgi:hypothetical protein